MAADDAHRAVREAHTSQRSWASLTAKVISFTAASQPTFCPHSPKYPPPLLVCPLPRLLPPRVLVAQNSKLERSLKEQGNYTIQSRCVSVAGESKEVAELV